MARIAPLLPLFCALSACATLPEPAGGEDNLPNAGAGPFRALVSGEIGNSRSAPNGLTDSRGYGRDVAVVDLDGDPATLGVAAYVAAAVKVNGTSPTRDTPPSVIQRYGALDGRSFDRQALDVLTADAAWEGGVLASPAVIRRDGQFYLYYAAAGGIGLARSSDGMTFTKEPNPVLAPEASGWEQGAAPASPGVVELADGSLRMFYEVTLSGDRTFLGEARSDDGITFTRVGSAPALSPSANDPDAGDAAWDAAGVSSPFPVRAVSGDGRPILRVYYGARDATGERTIGLAARYGDDGPLVRAVSPVFGTTKPLEPREPCVLVFKDFSLLYATEKSSTTSEDPVIAVGVAPATAMLPPPDPK
jgi:hypothetical protein